MHRAGVERGGSTEGVAGDGAGPAGKADLKVGLSRRAQTVENFAEQADLLAVFGPVAGALRGDRTVVVGPGLCCEGSCSIRRECRFACRLIRRCVGSAYYLAFGRGRGR